MGECRSPHRLQHAAPVEQAGYVLRRRCGGAVGEHQVQADAEFRQAFRRRNGISRSRTDHHEAGRRQDALEMGPLNRPVDLDGEAEIVRGDDQPVQLALSRLSRRKAKNSPASRILRLNISGLRAISQVIAAILGARR